METLGEVQDGEVVRFEIQSPTGRWLPFRGEVVHRQPNMGFGLRLEGLAGPQREALAHLINYALSVSD